MAIMKRKELVPYIPHDAQDIENTRRIIQFGYPAIAPVMRDLFNLMRVQDSPAADLLAEYFGTLGKAISEDVAKALAKENCWIRRRILRTIISGWSAEDLETLKVELCCVATQPDAYDNDIHALLLIRRHGLAEDKWIKQWKAFKRERLESRDQFLRTLE